MTSILQRPTSETTVYLDQPPSCLEFCPEIRDHFLVGTYLLSETKNESGDIQQTKTGSVQLWKLDPSTHALSLVHRLALPYAVFDLHFHPREKNKFAIVSSTGHAALFSVSDDSVQLPTINHIWTKQIHEDTSIPALFFAWTPRSWFPNSKAEGFAVTFSDSRTAVFRTDGDISDADNIEEWGSFEARQMIEVWFVSLAAIKQRSNEGEAPDHIIPYMFTGNDFGSLHTRRFESHGEKQDDTDQPLGSMLLEHDDRARHHTAGVTAILPLPVPSVDDAPILLTGSYDEGLRVYHATRRGDVLTEQGLGGGVWRLQLLSSTETHQSNDTNQVLERQFLVLASCMHAGTRVVRVSQKQQEQDSEWDIEILAEFTEHESMNYASDVWKGSRSEESEELQASSELLCVSSSFYDRRLCVWRVKS